MAPLCVIPEGAGPVKWAVSCGCPCFVFSDAVRVNASEAWGSRIGRKADREAAVGPGGPRRAGGCCSVSEKAGGCPVVPAAMVVVVVCSSAGGPRLVDRPEGWAVCHSFAASMSGMELFDRVGLAGRGQSSGATAPMLGSDNKRPAPSRGWGSDTKRPALSRRMAVMPWAGAAGSGPGHRAARSRPGRSGRAPRR